MAQPSSSSSSHNLAAESRQDYVEHTFEPLTFPADHPELVKLRADPGLEEYPSPLFSPPTDQLVGPHAPSAAHRSQYCYVTTLPKFIVAAFVNRGAAADGFARVKRYTGLIYFGRKCAGPPGCVHGGCLATAADALLGDFAVLVHNGLTMTRSITVCFRRFVELGSVVCFNVSPLIPEKGQSSNSPHAPEANLRPGDLAFHVSFHQTGSASPSGGPDSKSLLVEAHAVFSRPRQHYLPHVPLPPRTELAHAQPLGEVDGGANVPSARDEGIRVAFATRSFRNLVLQMPSTTTCWEAALRKVAVPSSRDGWWPPAARDACAQIVATCGLQPANLIADFGERAAEGLKAQFNDQCYFDMCPSSPPTRDGNSMALFDIEHPNAVRQLTAAPCKLRRRLFWRPTTPEGVAAGRHTPRGSGPLQIVAGVYYFGDLCQGAPRCAHGGAILTACDDIMGQLIVREVGIMPPSNTVALTTRFLTATPLNVPVVMVTRLLPHEPEAGLSPVEADARSRKEETQCVGWLADDFLAMSEPLRECWAPFDAVWGRRRARHHSLSAAAGTGEQQRGRNARRPLFISSASWKRPRPSAVGLEAGLSYDDLLMQSREADDDEDDEEDDVEGDDEGDTSHGVSDVGSLSERTSSTEGSEQRRAISKL